MICLRVYDNQGETFDRYRVQFDITDMDEGELLIGPTGNSHNGVCMWADGRFPKRDSEIEVDPYDLPKPVRDAIKNEFRIMRMIRRQYA